MCSHAHYIEISLPTSVVLMQLQKVCGVFVTIQCYFFLLFSVGFLFLPFKGIYHFLFLTSEVMIQNLHLWYCYIIGNKYLVFIPGFWHIVSKTFVISWVIRVSFFIMFGSVPDTRILEVLGISEMTIVSFCMLMVAGGWEPLGGFRMGAGHLIWGLELSVPPLTFQELRVAEEGMNHQWLMI